MGKNDWFASWFDTNYYHLLYKNRNDDEARLLIEHLVEHLNLAPNSKALDLACGKGRHSITLNELGFDVLGVDLSANSISEAKQFENETLHFDVCDMRESFAKSKFDAVFNLFTSFGYFDKKSDNEKVIIAMHEMLKENGMLVIDFMNTNRVIDTLVESETKFVDPIEFKITRQYDGNHIFKHINFDDKGKKYSYTERVQALKLNDFRALLTENGFNILSTFGDFDLNPFQEGTSDRLILVAEKK